QHLDFALEASCQVLTTHEIRKQHLHGLDAIGNETPYAVHTSHPATAELLDHLVIADALFGLHIQLSHTERSILLARWWRRRSLAAVARYTQQVFEIDIRGCRLGQRASRSREADDPAGENDRHPDQQRQGRDRSADRRGRAIAIPAMNRTGG